MPGHTATCAPYQPGDLGHVSSRHHLPPPENRAPTGNLQPHLFLMGLEMVQPLWERVWQFL